MIYRGTPPHRRAPKPMHDERLLAYMREQGRPVTTEEVAARYGWGKPYAYKQLNALVDEGLVERRLEYLPGFSGGCQHNWWEAT